MSAAVQDRLEQIWGTPRTFWGWLSSVDHKQIGRRYLATAMLFLIAGGSKLSSSVSSWLAPIKD